MSQRKLSPSTVFHASRECVETSGDVIKIGYVIRAFCQGTLVDLEHPPTEIVCSKIGDFFAGDVRLYGESLSGILLRCSHLRGLKRLPGVPGAFPILFFGPTSGFQEMKIGRGVRPFAEMTDGNQRFVDTTVLQLRAIKFVTNA